MRNLLIRFGLWLGITKHVDEEREARQELDRIMFYNASDEGWTQYMYERWNINPNVNKPRQPQEA